MNLSKLTLTKMLILSCIALLWINGYSQSTNVIVVDIGAVWPGDGSPLRPFRFIREGVDRASSQRRDILSVRPGIYYEHLTIEKPLIIRVDGPGRVTIGSPTTLLNDDSRETWTFRMKSVVVSDPQEGGGDEPYFLLFGIRSRFGSSGSTTVHWGGVLSRVALDLTCCRPATIPPRMGSFSWSNVNSTEDLSFRDGPDVLGVVVVAIEKDRCPWSGVESVAISKRDLLRREIENLIARKQLEDIILLAPLRINPDFEQDLADAKQRLEDEESGPLAGLAELIYQTVKTSVGCQFDKDQVIESKTLFFLPMSFDFPDSREENRFRLRRNRPHISIPLVFEGEGAKWKVAASMDLTGSDAN